MKNLKQSTRRIWLIVLGLLLIAAAAALGWNTWLRPHETEKEMDTYQYQQTANINYRVYFLPNQLFAEPSLGPGRYYLGSLTDRIDTFFAYKFTGQETADYSGSYTVKGCISALSEEDKKLQEVWRKDLTFVPATAFSGHDKQVLLNQQVSIPYQSYRVFAEQVREMTKFSPSAVNLTVEYTVNLSSKTSRGPLQEKSTSNIVIPLDSASFTVKGELQQDKSDALKTKVAVPVPGFKQLQMILGGLLVLFLALFLAVLLFTRAQKEFLTAGDKECRQLLKKHGERIIILNDNLPRTPADQMLAVQTFEDLLKAADELGQPILLEDTADQYVFCVRDGALLYQYLLSTQIPHSFYEEADIVPPVTS